MPPSRSTEGEPAAPGERTYHVELRQFPHNMCRFNLSGPELRATVLEPWARERWIEFGERKWNPAQAKLTVLEGPHIPVAQLTMGRGWRTAQREGREVTDELLAALAREVERGGPQGSQVGAPSSAAAAGVIAARAPGASSMERSADELAADSLGLELLSRLGSEPAPLRHAWELAGERHPDSPPSATLALAERAVESLLRARLIVLVLVRSGVGQDAGDAPALDEREVDRAIGAAASWVGGGVLGGRAAGGRALGGEVLSGGALGWKAGGERAGGERAGG
ncbi:MAG TPA: hypothetical protein VK756_08060, partial [Solirubrobacteraceae bacterium]|nr:hypothetical protein [Solirubrobacteraceae bacterium]